MGHWRSGTTPGPSSEEEGGMGWPKIKAPLLFRGGAGGGER